MASRRSFASIAVLLFASSLASSAQVRQQAYSAKADVSVTFTAERSLQTFTGQNFWKKGGSVTVGTNLWKGFGPAVDLSITHTNSIGTSGVGLTVTALTFGPRYRWHGEKKISPYGQALFGLAHGSDSAFPGTGSVSTSANSFGMLVDGGVDCHLTSNFDLRMVEAGWSHSTLSNGSENKQNNFRIGSGIAFRFGK
jgi:peptidoglycan-associated lipoprotein